MNENHPNDFSSTSNTWSQSSQPASARERMTLNQLTMLRWPLDVALKHFRECKLTSIGVSWRKLNEFGIQHGIRAIRESGLRPSSLGWIGGFTGSGQHAGEDAVRDGKRAIRAAGRLNAKCVTVITGPTGSHIKSHASRIVADSLKELGDLAAAYEVKLALQPMHPLFSRRWTFLNSLDATFELMDSVGRSSIQLGFGSYHLFEEPNLMGRIPEIAARTALVSLSDRSGKPRHDNDRWIPGTGTLPIKEMITAFEQAGYSGAYELEVWSKDLWKRNHRDYMQDCLQSGYSTIPAELDAKPVGRKAI